MKLSSEKIRSLTTGAVGITETGEGLAFAKCTSAQLDAFREAAPWIVPNVEATTGVRLDFGTDSPFVRVRTVQGDKFEILVDGMLTGQYLMNDARDFTVRLPEGCRHRVTVTLPSHGTPGVIAGVELADGAMVGRPIYDTKMLFLGDSITQGWNTRFDSQSFAYLISRHYHAESVIQGVGGAFFCPPTVPDPDAVGFVPDTVIVAYGTNDWSFVPSAEKLRENAGESLRRVKEYYPGARIFVLTPIWRADEGEDRPMGPFPLCRAVVREEAEKAGLRVIDGSALVPPRMEYMADAVHPNDLGFAHYALNLIREMEK